MAPTFQSRLRRVLLAGNLTVADLARWFNRSDPTVRGWVNGVRLGGPQLDAAYVVAQLVVLERRITKRQGFPVPRMTRPKRIAYLAQIQRKG